MTKSESNNVPSALLTQVPKSARLLWLGDCGIDDMAIVSRRQISPIDNESWCKLAEIGLRKGEQAIREIRQLAEHGWEYLVVTPDTHKRIQQHQPFGTRLAMNFPALFWDDAVGIVFALRLADQQPELMDFLTEFKKREHRYPAVLNWQSYQAMGCFFPNCTLFAPPNPDAQTLPYIDKSIDVILVPTDNISKKNEALRIATSAVMEIAIMPGKSPWLNISIGRCDGEILSPSKSEEENEKWLGRIVPATKRPVISVGPQEPPHEDENNGVRIVSFYLPQFHPIPENDLWWGQGFTEWRNVCNSEPLFHDHQQPQLPADLGFYDLRSPETRQAQTDMARSHGIEAFCYWHYWFQGKRLLERPFNEVLRSGKPDFPFCLCWANEPWTRRWDGLDQGDTLQPQSYSAEDDLEHIRWLLEPLSDPRAFRIDGKPVFIVYRADQLPDPVGTTDCWRREAERTGLSGLYLMAVETGWDAGWDATQSGFDAKVLFQPQFSLLGKVPQLDLGPSTASVFDYDEAWPVLANPDPVSYTRYETVFPGWDNSPRRGEKAWIVDGNSPSSYEDWLKLAVQRAMERPKDQRIVFINAWNEWAEGAHLEPDRKHGLGFLEATKRVVTSSRTRQP